MYNFYNIKLYKIIINFIIIKIFKKCNRKTKPLSKKLHLSV